MYVLYMYIHTVCVFICINKNIFFMRIFDILYIVQIIIKLTVLSLRSVQHVVQQNHEDYIEMVNNTLYTPLYSRVHSPLMHKYIHA